jgi:hypothetical protein
LFFKLGLCLPRIISLQSVSLLLGLRFLPDLSSYSSVGSLPLSFLLLEGFLSSFLLDAELFLVVFIQSSLLSTLLQLNGFLNLSRAEQYGTSLARFIAFCIEKKIDLVVLPLHTSHILQPLDVGVFSPLKQALLTEIEKLFRLDTCQILRIEWTEAYITARNGAFIPRTIESSFRASGIYLLSPIAILSTLRMPTPTSRVTPLPITTPDDLDRSLLDGSPPEGKELREPTSLVNSIIRSSTLITPVKQYIERSGSALERTTSENALLRKELTEARELSRVRKERKKGKRVAVKGNFVFNTKEILELVEEAEAEALKGKSKSSERQELRLPKSRTRMKRISRIVFTRARVIVLS